MGSSDAALFNSRFKLAISEQNLLLVTELLSKLLKEYSPDDVDTFPACISFLFIRQPWLLFYPQILLIPGPNRGYFKLLYLYPQYQQAKFLFLFQKQFSTSEIVFNSLELFNSAPATQKLADNYFMQDICLGKNRIMATFYENLSGNSPSKFYFNLIESVHLCAFHMSNRESCGCWVE